MKRWVIIFLSLIAFCGAAFATLHWAANTMFDVSPKRVVEVYFENTPKEMTTLRGAGVSWLGHDAWIRFQSNANIQLKHAANYGPTSPEEAQAWFLETCPEDVALLQNTQALTCLQAQDPDVHVSNGKWLLVHKPSKTYFFRTWRAD